MGSVLGVVLAAGPGSRFAADSKLLATFEGRPLVRHAAATLADARSVDRVLAVVGHEADRVGAAIAGAVDGRLHNPDHRDGMGTSVRLGARAGLEDGADAVAFLPGDMPCVDPDTVDRLVAAHREDPRSIVLPEREGRRGNPVVVPARYLESLLDLDGDVGARGLFDRAALRRVAVQDPGIHRDVDTRGDLEALRHSGCAETRS